jgi:hypothetical protein
LAFVAQKTLSFREPSNTPEDAAMAVRVCCPSCDFTFDSNGSGGGRAMCCPSCGKPIIDSVAAPKLPKSLKPPEPDSLGRNALFQPAVRLVLEPRRRFRLPLLIGAGCLALLGFFILYAGGIGSFLRLKMPDQTEASDRPEPPYSAGSPQTVEQNPSMGGRQKVGAAPESVDGSTKAQQPPKDAQPANGQLDHKVLAKVKNATVFMKVVKADGSNGQGSGFFGVESGLVITNAHVLGTLKQEDPPPRKVEVVYCLGLVVALR